MDTVSGKLTVFFDDPFWIGVFERTEGGRLYAARTVFGAEPGDPEVLEFVLKRFGSLQFSPAVAADMKEAKKNPKRVQRGIGRSLTNTGAGTRSQQALKLLREQNKQERKVRSREQKRAEAERLFALKQKKKKEKHRGR